MRNCNSLAGDRCRSFAMQIGKFIQASVGATDWLLRAHVDKNQHVTFASEGSETIEGFGEFDSRFEGSKHDACGHHHPELSSECVTWRAIRRVDGDFSIARLAAIVPRSQLGKTSSLECTRLELRLAWDSRNVPPPEDNVLIDIFRPAAKLLEHTIATESRYHVVNSALAAYRTLDIGCLVFDFAGNLLFINPIAQTLIPIDTNSGKALDLHSPQIRSEIRRVLAVSKHGGGRAICENIAMLLPSGKVRPAYFQAVAPDHYSLDDSHKLISVFVPTCEGLPSTETLKLAFGLTRSEALVAAGISNGLSLKEISEELSLTIETARTYSKRIYSKLGISRQSELASRILRSTLPEKTPQCCPHSDIR